MIKISGKEYESAEFGKRKLAAILSLQSMDEQKLKALIKEAIKGEHAGRIIAYIEVRAREAGLKLYPHTKMLSALLCENKLHALIFLADISEKFPSPPTLLDIGYRLYPFGFYTPESAVQRCFDIITAEESDIPELIREEMNKILEEMG